MRQSKKDISPILFSRDQFLAGSITLSARLSLHATVAKVWESYLEKNAKEQFAQELSKEQSSFQVQVTVDNIKLYKRCKLLLHCKADGKSLRVYHKLPIQYKQLAVQQSSSADETCFEDALPDEDCTWSEADEHASADLRCEHILPKHLMTAEDDLVIRTVELVHMSKHHVRGNADMEAYLLEQLLFESVGTNHANHGSFDTVFARFEQFSRNLSQFSSTQPVSYVDWTAQQALS